MKLFINMSPIERLQSSLDAAHMRQDALAFTIALKDWYYERPSVSRESLEKTIDELTKELETIANKARVEVLAEVSDVYFTCMQTEDTSATFCMWLIEQRRGL